MPSKTDPAANGQPELDRTIQDHIGRKLRSKFNQEFDKPAFLGDPALPLEFDNQLQQLDRTIKTHEDGVRAVGTALGVDDGADENG